MCNTNALKYKMNHCSLIVTANGTTTNICSFCYGKLRVLFSAFSQDRQGWRLLCTVHNMQTCAHFVHSLLDHILRGIAFYTALEENPHFLHKILAHPTPVVVLALPCLELWLISCLMISCLNSCLTSYLSGL